MFRHRSHHSNEITQPAETIPLSDMLPGESGQVVEFRGGGKLVSRMAALGFSLGVQITILQNCRPGPLIACVRESRVALGHGEATHILIQRDRRNDADCLA